MFQMSMDFSGQGIIWQVQCYVNGVPQGHVLSQLLFIYYVNDIPFKSTCTSQMLADDLSIYLHHNNINDLNDSLNWVTNDLTILEA